MFLKASVPVVVASGPGSFVVVPWEATGGASPAMAGGVTLGEFVAGVWAERAVAISQRKRPQRQIIRRPETSSRD